MSVAAFGQAVGQFGAEVAQGLSLGDVYGPVKDAYMAQQNIDLQKEFAKNGIQWRAEDARKAGIHPVAALGASGAQFSPVHVGSSDPDPSRSFLSGMGQHISRAARAMASHTDRQRIELGELQLENMKLQNGLLGQRLHAAQQSQVGPGMPEEPGTQPDVSYSKTKGGGLAPIPSEAFADRAEDQWLPQIAWGARNLLVPRDPKRSPGKGNVWVYNPAAFEFQAVPIEKAGFGDRRFYLYNKFRKWLYKE